MSKIIATTNKVIINYVDGQTYTFPRIYDFNISQDGKYVTVRYNRNKKGVQQDIEEKVSLKHVDSVTYRKSGTQGTVEYIVVQGVVEQIVETKDFITAGPYINATLVLDCAGPKTTFTARIKNIR
ncbi:hypothetical protein NVP1084O_002 [Vibrio phage 1.084.O._10N.261.49.F5]|nr:hypothetical protein NVP1084O_002 [Vibrio phage 1.084.O._10N.261.49.F5]